MKIPPVIKRNIFNISAYTALLIAGVWTAIKGDFAVAALIFFGLSTLLLNVGDRH